MQLIRDADKLDIWKVFGDYCQNDQHPEAAIVQHLSDQPTWEPEIIEAILCRQMANFQDMKSVTDFMLLQLSWVFDLNYPESLKQAHRRGDLANIACALPDHQVIRRAVDIIFNHLSKSVSPNA